ncbi:MAG: type VI secretion system tip protein VgrG [Geminicoccaceae bacterium]|nr:type VI secretion system tip protein VgrG [Geminicoccaceae bacterium]
MDGWQAAAEVRSGRTTLEDFDFEKPRTDLLAAEADPPPHPLADAEIYDYPGGYRDLAAGDARARLRLEEELTGHALAVGTGNASGLACGARFALEGFPRRRENRSWVVVATEIELSSERYRSSIGAPEREPFRCRIEAHELERPWRPARRTPRPVVQGPQTAIVTGPPGEEIRCDRYGRIKVKFHWDRKGREDETSSCWLRVSQAWAGAGWGAMHVPRVGQEVIVDFLEGDPDRPIVTGRVYNALSMPPWSLPGNATQSGVKSDSSKGGGGSNELRFEDRKGSEQVWLHAQKDEDIVVENDKTERVGHDETLSVGNDRSREVGGDETVSVDGEQKVTIGKSRTDTVKASEKRTVYIAQKQKVGGLRSVQVGAAQSHTVGANDSWRVIGGRKVKIGRGLGVEVGKERTTKIGQGDSLEVGGGRTSKITGDDTLEVGGSSAGKVAKDRSTEIGGGDTLKVAKGLLVEAGEQVVIKTGSAAIAMKKDGTITITGKDVTIDASGKITLKASGNVIVKGQKIEHN